jgi:hypothetical protein
VKVSLARFVAVVAPSLIQMRCGAQDVQLRLNIFAGDYYDCWLS